MDRRKLLIHSDALSLRGDTTNSQSISIYLKLFYGIDSVVVAPSSQKQNSFLRINDLLSQGINVQLYDTQNHLNKIAQLENVTHSYFLTSGKYSNLWIPDTKHLVHAVFNWYEPHGDVYAYVSEWLYLKATKDQRTRDFMEIEQERVLTSSPFRLFRNCKVTWVPHTVVAKKGNGDQFRDKYSISSKFRIVGRIGGYDQFNDKAAMLGISKVLSKTKNIKFVFVNTKRFLDHPQVQYIDALNDNDKWDFYDAGDLFLNGRSMGETFGFSIIEPLMVGKPVIAPDRIRHPRMDAAHMNILRRKALTYYSATDFARKVVKLVEENMESNFFSALVSQFTPENSIKRFYSEFLQ